MWYSWQTGFWNSTERLKDGTGVIFTPVADQEYYADAEPENMVSFEAYGDDEVVIKASELVTDFNPSTGWRVQGNFKDEIDREKIRIWEYRLNPELFKGYNPFCAEYITRQVIY